MRRGKIGESSWDLEEGEWTEKEFRFRLCRTCWEMDYVQCLSCGASMTKPRKVFYYPAFNFEKKAPLCPSCAVLTPRIDESRNLLQEMRRELSKKSNHVPFFGRGNLPEFLQSMSDSIDNLLGYWKDKKLYPPRYGKDWP